MPAVASYISILCFVGNCVTSYRPNPSGGETFTIAYLVTRSQLTYLVNRKSLTGYKFGACGAIAGVAACVLATFYFVIAPI